MKKTFSDEDYAYVEDFSSIQAALNSTVPKIKFRNKTYVIDQPLTMTNFHILEGVGRDCGGGTVIEAGSNFPVNSSMLTIACDAAEISHLSFKGGESSSYKAENGIKAIPGSSNPNTTLYGLRLQDVCVTYCSEIGVDLAAFMCTLDRVTVRYCGQGFYIHGIEDGTGSNYIYVPGTTMLLSQCYARACPYAGFEVANMNYSLMMCCAADDCGMQTSTTNLNGRSLSNGYGYAYRFYGCHNLDIISCGAEISYYSLFFTLCSNIRINNFSEYNPNNRSWITSAPISLVQCSFMSFNNCSFEGKKDITQNNSNSDNKRVILIASGNNSSSRISFFYCSVELRTFVGGVVSTETDSLTNVYVFGEDSNTVSYY